MSRPQVNRVYAPLLSKLRAVGTRESRMKRVCDLLWEKFSVPLHAPDENDPHEHPPISWVGFYSKQAESEEMILEVRRDKPACSPIGLHGMCGRSWREKRAIVVADVAVLGANYIACDPNDKSELVVPLFNDDGTCWGVLDADSYHVGAFNEHDVAGMTQLLERVGLSARQPSRAATLVL